MSTADSAYMVLPIKYNLWHASQSKGYVNAIIDEYTGKPLKYWQWIIMDKCRAVWQLSFTNKLGQLTQWVWDIEGTDTINFMPMTSVPDWLIVM